MVINCFSRSGVSSNFTLIGDGFNRLVPGELLCLSLILQKSKQIVPRKTKGWAIPGWSNLSPVARKSIHQSLSRRAFPAFQPFRSWDEEKVTSFQSSLAMFGEIEELDDSRQTPCHRPAECQQRGWGSTSLITEVLTVIALC